MLTLQLTLTGQQVSVHANRKESHQFSLLDLSQSKEEWKDFLNSSRAYGEKLYNVLFKNVALVEFNAVSKQTERTIVLVLESSDLDGVAWEYAYNKAKEEYVVEDCAFVRALPESERPSNGRLKASYERVPLLFIPANPLVDVSGEPLRALDEESEWKEISKHITASNAGFDLSKMLPATPAQLQTVMAQFREGLIVHFSGHGATTKDGAILLFERENGASNPLEAREFVREIKDKAAITFLSACQSAVAERTEFSNLARGLVKAGVPFALGMQFNLPDPFAPDISGQFYNYLTRGHGVPEAARQARRAVKREHEFFVGMIALYAAHPDEMGALRWSGAGAKTSSLFRPADVSDLPSPASGLIGRERELMRIGTQLFEAKKPLTVTLHGAGGIGKTALLWQALLRFAPSFELTLAIALDPLPSLESVLGRIERFLGLPSPCSNDTKERETLVRNALMSKRTLLGLDNFETLNYALNEKDGDQEKTAKSLHAFFKSLAANGVTLCVTSREVTNLPGETIIDIEGLTNENGGRLFQENVVRQKGEIYIEKTQQVSEMVGGHPLALRLLASAFDDQVGTSLDQYIENLQSFLPKARDKWTEEDRHESLRASFDFTMKNLVKTEEGKELQTALAKLSVFVAFFNKYAAMPVLENGIPTGNNEQYQAVIRTAKTLHALWRRGMLDADFSLLEEEFYLYRLHPVLQVFAGERLVDIGTVKENYWKSMNQFVGYVEEQFKKNPLEAQVVFRALPDLLAAAEAKNDKNAALMQFRISKLMMGFGLYDDALYLLGKSRNLNESLQDLKGKSATMDIIAEIIAIRGDLDGAMKLFLQSLDIEESLGDQEGKSTTLYHMARILATRGDLDEAMKLFQQSFVISEGHGNLEGKSTTLREMAHVFFMRGDLDGAMKLCQQSLEISESLGDLLGKCAALHLMARIFNTRGDLNRAMKLYQQSLEISESFNNIQGKSATLYHMAEILVTRGDLDEAMKLLLQSLDIVEGLGDLEGKSSILLAMGDVFVMSDKLKVAMELYQRSLEIFDGFRNLQGKSVTLARMGGVLIQGKDYALALVRLVDALVTSQEIGADFEVQPIIEILMQLRQAIGAREFSKLWQAIFEQPIPEWLA